ncbi:hypothetical protein [Streptomyces sp. bgisy159]|uniref:hypothetical protein n=1 Tax=Streptomyces sp. bgisy159 TaxID=3413795 RepID=UPI003F4A22C2
MTEQPQSEPQTTDGPVSDEHGSGAAPDGVPAPPPLPPMPPQAPPPPEAPEQAPAPAPVKKDRRVLRAVLRWTAAVVVFATAGAGTAYGITRMERTDVPGLATESDGRWEYPALSRPPLPSGSPGPFAVDNEAGTHHADLRALVLPAPKGATEDKALRGTDGWLATKDLLAEFPDENDRAGLAQQLKDYGLRHVAARGWTTPDGTHTRVYLLRFSTAEVAESLSDELVRYGDPAYRVRGTDEVELDEDFPENADVRNVERSPHVEKEPYGDEQVRYAYLTAGDVVALVVQSRKGGAAAVPFQQTVVLQSQLLG